VKKVVHAKVNPGETQKLNFVANSSLGEAATIVIGSDKHQIQLTIHRPIGWTTIDGDTWVLSETSDIPSFLMKANHPHEKEFNESLYKEAIEHAIQKGFLTKTTDGKLAYPDGNIERSQYLKLRNKHAKFLEKLASYEKSQDKSQKPPSKPEGLPEDWSPDEKLNSKEDEVSIFLKKEVEHLHTVKNIDPYETTGGSFGTKRQRPIKSSKGKRLVEVVEMVTSQLLSMTEDPPKGVPTAHGSDHIPQAVVMVQRSDTDEKKFPSNTKSPASPPRKGKGSGTGN